MRAIATRLSITASAAILKYGPDACLQALAMHNAGEGASTIAATHPNPNIRTTRQADAAINAGRELSAVNAHVKADAERSARSFSARRTP